MLKQLHRFMKFRGLEVLVNEQVDTGLAHELEKQAFLHEPPETKEGLDVIASDGFLLMVKDIGIAEAIELNRLLKLNLGALPPESPLRMIAEHNKRYGIVDSIRRNYPGRQAYHYLHGIAVNENARGQGYGSWLFEQRTKRILGENELQFGFVLPYDIPSLRMYMGNGAFLANVADGVYNEGQTYFTMIHDRALPAPDMRRNYLSRSDNLKIALGGKKSMHEIRVYLNAGFVGTSFKEPDVLVFQRRLNHPDNALTSLSHRPYQLQGR